MLLIYCLLFLLGLLPGLYGELYLLNGQETLCIHEVFAKSDVLDFNVTSCYYKTVDRYLKFDYDYHTGKLYYLRNSRLGAAYQFISCTTIKNNLHCDTNLYTKDVVSNVTDMAWDWIHKSMYVSDRHGQRLAIKDETSLRELPCNCTRSNTWESYRFGVKVIATSVGIDSNEVAVENLQVDPYNSSLFLKLQYKKQFGENEDDFSIKTVILCSDLLAKNAKLTPDRRFSKEMEFNVDINEHKVYVWDGNDIFTYDYNGRELKSQKITLVGEPHSFVVFNQLLTYTIDTDYGEAYILGRYNLTNNKEDSLHIVGVRKPIKVYDARSKRQMINGTYTCDRSDCSDKCEVQPVGDTCECRPFRAKQADGIKCYDCGRSPIASVSAELTIVNGENTTLGEFPWHGIIYEQRDGEWEQACGGTLIASKVVLTAAHCVLEYVTKSKKDPKNLTVVFGKIYRDWNTVEKTEMRMKVKEIRPHEGYAGESNNFAQDVALLILESKVNYTVDVMPACLGFNQNQLPPVNRLTAQLPGFGLRQKLYDFDNCRSEVLKYSSTKNLKTYAECVEDAKEKLKNSNMKRHRLTLSSDKICIDEAAVNVAQKGDSGTGLTVVHNGINFLVGILSVSWFGYDGSTAVYNYRSFSDVNMQMDWLISQLPKEE